MGPPVPWGKGRHVVETGGFAHELVQMVTETVDAMREPKRAPRDHVLDWFGGSTKMANTDCRFAETIFSRSRSPERMRSGPPMPTQYSETNLTSETEARPPRQMNGWEFVLVRPKRFCSLCAAP
jgi:hypothetical protein